MELFDIAQYLVLYLFYDQSRAAEIINVWLRNRANFDWNSAALFYYKENSKK